MEITRKKIEERIGDGYLMVSSIAFSLGSTTHRLSRYLTANQLEWLIADNAIDIHAIRRYCQNCEKLNPAPSEIAAAIRTRKWKLNGGHVKKCLESHGETVESVSRRPKLERTSTTCPATRCYPIRPPEMARAEMVRAGRCRDKFRPIILRHAG